MYIASYEIFFWFFTKMLIKFLMIMLESIDFYIAKITFRASESFDNGFAFNFFKESHGFWVIGCIMESSFHKFDVFGIFLSLCNFFNKSFSIELNFSEWDDLKWSRALLRSNILIHLWQKIRHESISLSWNLHKKA